MMTDAEIGSPFIIHSTPKPSHTKLWFLRKWRSLPRFFKLYLVIAIIVLFVIFSILTTSSTSKTHLASSFPPLPDSLRERVVTSLPLRPPNVKSKSDGNDESVQQQQKDVDRSLINFQQNVKDTQTVNQELSYKKDLLTQRITKDQEKVIQAMIHSWNGYKKYAWGSDHLKPLSMKEANWFNVGLTIIDSIDTLILMGLENEYKEAKEWIENSLTFDIYRDVNCFEMTIRVLGGLLSAFHLTKEPIFLHKSLDVGNRLIHCFDSPSKSVPFSDVNLRTKVPKSPAWSPDSSLSEVSSVQLEFRDLYKLISIEKEESKHFPNFEEISFKTSQHLHHLVKERKDSLLPMYINPNNGQLTPSTITLGARGDSYYEYLLKQYLQTGIQWLHDDYLDAVDAIKDRLIKTTLGSNKFVYVAELLRSKEDVNPKMDHLVCFLPGTLALGYYHYSRQQSIQNGGYHGSLAKDDNNEKLTFSDRFSTHLELAEDLARTCYNMYNMTATGLSPEIVYFGTTQDEQEMIIRPADSHNLLRPEYVESLFYLYHITGNVDYRKQGSRILDSFNTYCKVATGGYTTIDDVRFPDHVRPKNMMESFWTAETLKYLYLLHSDETLLISKIMNNYVFNTEAHLIPIKTTTTSF